jgi:hypothetical protein
MVTFDTLRNATFDNGEDKLVETSGPSLSLIVTKPLSSQREAITPQVHTRAIQEPLKCISPPRESLKITIDW